MQTLKNRAFTLIEILIVIIIIIVFVVIAYPRVSNYMTDREVRKEVYSLVEYIKQKKTEAVSGKYAMAWIWISGKSSGRSQSTP